jgi:uncharacterized membrane protein YdjX (TVP38/TMEM64 family)
LSAFFVLRLSPQWLRCVKPFSLHAPVFSPFLVDLSAVGAFCPQMFRFLLIPLILIVIVIVPFAIWGEALTGFLSPNPDTGEFSTGRQMFWAVAIGLLVADIAIPIPTTSVVAALGIVYGPILGALIGTVGAMTAAAAGWTIGRFLGRPVAAYLVGDALEGGEKLFARHGGWIVALSRWAPVLPEVVSAVAGVSRMPFGVFMAAALCGVAPFCLVFAIVGHLGADWPVITLVVSAVAPFILWCLAKKLGLARILNRRGDR